MEKNVKAISGIAIIMAMAIFIVPRVTLAGISMSPLQQWVDAKPGAEGEFTLTIANIKRSPEAKSQTVVVKPVHFLTNLEGDLKFGPEYKHKRSAADWIGLKQNEFVLEPNEVKVIEMKIKVPTNADGDYWAALMVSTKKPKQKNITFDFRAASGVFVRVNRRNYVERGDISDISVAMPDFNIMPDIETDDAETKNKITPFKIKAHLNNTGLITFIANTKAVIYSDKWKTIATIPMFASRRRVYPAESRAYQGALSDPLPAGKYIARVFVDSETKLARKIINDIKFNVTDQQAKQWAKLSNKDESGKQISIAPKEIRLELTDGRLTSARFTISNDAMATISAAFSKSGDVGQWLEFRSPTVAIGPKMQRTIISTLRVPKGTKPGDYKGMIVVDIEKAGLAGKDDDNKKKIEITLAVTVAK